VNEESFGKFFWFGCRENISAAENFCYITIFDTFRYVFFRFRTRRVLPEVATLISEMIFFLNNLLNANKKIREKFLKINNIARFVQARG
jgi:hypothetical protein